MAALKRLKLTHCLKMGLGVAKVTAEPPTAEANATSMLGVLLMLALLHSSMIAERRGYMSRALVMHC